MAAQHSPGPWAVDPETGGESVLDAEHRLVADCAIFGVGFTAERNRANACLIATAPGLLAACEAQHHAIDILLALCVNHIPGFMPTKSAAWPAAVQGHAAIAKATGAQT